MTEPLTPPHGDATPLTLIAAEAFEAWAGRQTPLTRQWLAAQSFTGKSNSSCWLPDADGKPATVAVGVEGAPTIATMGGLPMSLPPGVYHLAGPVDELLPLGWALGAYQFTRYKAPAREPARLAIEDDAQRERVLRQYRACAFTRDLVNVPAGDLGPVELAGAAADLAARHGAEYSEIVGDDLLDAGLAVIHAVGRAAEDRPRLAEFVWGDPSHPKVTLVGKGVCFDSGGLDIKPASGMRWMKKDMGGAAHVLGLADLIMTEGLALRLRVLVPAVENAIGGNAFHPGDILRSHKGLSIEIDNTDAEGRLILCDALSLAGGDAPELIVDYATLTGAARVALGTELPVMFANDDTVASGIAASGAATDDPVWRLPLHDGYRQMLDSNTADLVNAASAPYGGAITAALFLQRFVDDTPWVHFDIMAFNVRNRPGRPEGGEAMGLRAVFGYLADRYGAV